MRPLPNGIKMPDVLRAKDNGHGPNPANPANPANADTPQEGLRHPHLPELGDDVWHGPAGDHAKAIDATTEADALAVLVGDLAWASCRIGSGSHVLLGRERHYARVWPILLGPTATGRKGTAATESIRALGRLAPGLPPIKSGLSSGEGIIESFIGDPTPDERLLILEGEWESVLARMRRDGNTLAGVLRDAWDGVPLSTLTIHARAVEQHHLVVTGHITGPSFRHALSSLDVSNGFLNRFLILLVRRAKLVDPFADADQDDGHLRTIIERAQKAPNGRVLVTPRARQRFNDWYMATEADREELPERVAMATARYTGHAIRVALTYAILDGAREVDVPHVAAGIALADYSNACAHLELGIGRAGLDGRILAALPATGEWMGRDDLSTALGKRVKAKDLDDALAVLGDLVESQTIPRDGRGRIEYRRTDT